MRTLMIALGLACVPFAAAAQEGRRAAPVPAAAVESAANTRRLQRTKAARPGLRVALRAPDASVPRKQKDPAAPRN